MVLHCLVFLILFPLLPAVLMLLLRNETIRNVVIISSATLIALVSIVLAFAATGSHTIYFNLSPGINNLVVGGDIMLALVFLLVCRQLPLQRSWIPLLIIVQYAPVIFFETTGRVPESTTFLFIDNLSVIMALLIGIVGSLIAVYTIGYMKHYHKEHPDIPDRTNKFIATIFLFFFAMYGIIFTNHITWMYLFWEITTLCSFIMIGYPKTEEARHNSFRALWMLLLGGLGFALAIIYCSRHCGTIELYKILHGGMDTTIILFPVMLICFAGINKAAQFPFSSWLLGAMVAPTPSSALLHSSTMVKAGVYVLIRCSPVFHQGDKTSHICGILLALVGGLTFVMGSAIAVSERNGKRVLAYSTVANLGLIVVCAGVGTPLAIWAAIMLVIFHGIAKALMFLCVGTVDQQLSTLNIEDMHGLISRMPYLTMLMLIGMAGMFLAPFGMLISKWAVLEALAQKTIILPILVIFGGSLMLYFWAKWMGVLVAITNKRDDVEKNLGLTEWIPMGSLAGLTILACATFPLIGRYMIRPMIGTDPLFSRSHLLMLGILMLLVLLLPLGFLLHRKHLHYVAPYLGGANVAEPHQFMDSFGQHREWKLSNYYLHEFFSEEKLAGMTNNFAITLIVIMIILPLL